MNQKIIMDHYVTKSWVCIVRISGKFFLGLKMSRLKMRDARTETRRAHARHYDGCGHTPYITGTCYQARTSTRSDPRLTTGVCHMSTFKIISLIFVKLMASVGQSPINASLWKGLQVLGKMTSELETTRPPPIASKYHFKLWSTFFKKMKYSFKDTFWSNNFASKISSLLFNKRMKMQIDDKISF